jgi:hypothetical protein
MGVEWNSDKAAANAKKHGVDFADAALALEDPRAVTIEDPDSIDEGRYISLGMDPNGRVLVTIFTYRSDNVRVISSRKASKQERRRYEERK